MWTIAAPQAAVDPDGTAKLSVVLRDTGVPQGTLTFTMTAERVLTVLWDQQPGVEALAGFQAWSNEP